MEKCRGFFNRVYDAEAKGLDPFGNISTNATESDQKLYVGNLPLYLRDDDIKKLCESFGFMKYFNLVHDHEGNHKGYCFIEYVDPKSTEKALKHLNDLEIGDRKVKVQKVVTPAGGSAPQGPANIDFDGPDKPKPTNAVIYCPKILNPLGWFVLAWFPINQRSQCPNHAELPILF